MANPQVEDGAIKIAFDLDQALIRADLSGLEKDVTRAVMHLSYGNGKKTAELSVEDLRILLSSEARQVRSYRIRECLDSLVSKRVLTRTAINQYASVLGVQKDFEKWFIAEEALPEEVQKIGMSINRSIVNNKSSSIGLQNICTTICVYTHRAYQGTYGIGAYRTELKHAKQLYREALMLTRDPVKAAQAIKDYVDDLNSQEWFSQCKMRLVYMSSRFRAWYKAAPSKPKNIKEQEEDTGYKFRYNRTTKQWEITSTRRDT
jgi:hypothetical protein